MAIYGNSIATMSLTEDKMISISEMFNFINESDMEMACMFERANIIQIIKEDNTEIAIPKEMDYSTNPETVKKTVIEKVKDLVSKFITFVKTSFQKLVESIQKFYLEHNINDSFFSKWKDKVTWNNLLIAKDKGWNGIPITIAMPGKPANISDSGFYRDIYENLGVAIDIEKDINPIVLAEDYPKSKELYDIFVEKNSKFKKEIEKREKDFIYGARAQQNGSAYFRIGPDRHKVGAMTYYYPDGKGFIATKTFAENGQKHIKELQFGSKEVIKQMNLSKDVELNNMKSYKKGGANESEDKEINKIEILYYRARYEFASTMIFCKSKIMQTIINCLKDQHKNAMQCYMYFIRAYHISQKDTKDVKKEKNEE